jgi:hypothetical protein
LGDDINTIKKNTDGIVDARKEFGLEVNTEKTKYMLMFRHLNAGQNHSMRIANRPFENVAKLKYLGMTLGNKYCTHEEIKSRSNSGNSCYHLVQNPSFSCTLSKKL